MSRPIDDAPGARPTGVAAAGVDSIGVAVAGVDSIGVAVAGVDSIGVAVAGVDSIGVAAAGVDSIRVAVAGVDSIRVAVAGVDSIRVAVAGASGRMGRMLIEAVTAAPDMTLVGALDVASSAAIGHDASAWLGTASGVVITSDVRMGIADADVLIDFTRPEGTLAHLAACADLGVKAVIGTTGFDAAQKALIAGFAERTAVMMAPNMSVGVNVVMKLLDLAARALATGYDIEIIEAHHRHKVDAPSGTALKMGEVVAAALGRNLDGVGVYDRHGVTGERDPSSIGFATIRGGDIVGDHTVLFAGTGERIEITHRSSSRVTYAQGSVRAARFLADKPRGMFDMNDVLGLG